MKPESSDFITFLLEIGALKFGDFTLKSGRKSPYFFNSASFDSGSSIEKLGRFYAARIARIDPRPTVVFGPAYKGIPLAVAACISLEQDFGIETAYCFDRKEAKGHGDKGMLVGRTPGESDRIVMVDDVVTDGGTKVEAVAALRKFTPAPVSDIVIALNRQERNAKGGDPIAGLESQLGVRVHSIVTLDEILRFLEEKGGAAGADFGSGLADRIRDYRARYGIDAVSPASTD